MQIKPAVRTPVRSQVRHPLHGAPVAGIPGRPDMVGLFLKDSTGSVVDTIGESSISEKLDGVTGRRVVVFFGDSITQGAWAGLTAALWDSGGFVGLMREHFQRKYGDGGRGFIGLDRTSEWAQTGSWTNNSEYGPYGKTYSASGSANKYTLSDVYGDNIDIFYLDASGAGAYTVSVDGGDPITLTPVGNANNVAQKHNVSLGDYGQHTVEISAPETGTLYLEGAAVYRGQSGCVVHNIGKSGAVAQDLGYRIDDKLSLLPHLTPHVCVIGFLANDRTAQKTLVSYETNLGLIHQKCADNGADLITIVPPDHNMTELTITTLEYETGAESVATAYSSTFVNIHELWGDYSAASGFMYDDQHPNEAGHSRMYVDILAATGEKLIVKDRVATGNYEAEKAVSTLFDGSLSGRFLNGDGSGHDITITGDFIISASAVFVANDTSIIGGETLSDGLLWFRSINQIDLWINGVSYSFTGLGLFLNTPYDLVLTRTDTTLSLSIGGATVNVAGSADDLTLRYVGKWGGGNIFQGNLWNLRLEDSVGVKLSNFLAQDNTTGVMDSEVGPTVTFSGVGSYPIVEESVKYGHEWSNYSVYSGATHDSHAIHGKVPAAPSDPMSDIFGNNLTHAGTPQRNLEIVHTAPLTVKALPNKPTVLADAANVLFDTSGNSKTVAFSTLEALEGPQLFGSEERRVFAVYDPAPTGSILERANRYFNVSP